MNPDIVSDAFVLCLFLMVGGILILGVSALLSLIRMFVTIHREARASRARRWWL